MSAGAAEVDGGTGDGAVEVTLDGELDLASLDDAERLVAAAEVGAPALLVIDLAALRFIDSTGVRLVLQADARARAEQRRLAVRLGTGRALRVFRALGLLDKVEVLPPAHPDGSR